MVWRAAQVWRRGAWAGPGTGEGAKLPNDFSLHSSGHPPSTFPFRPFPNAASGKTTVCDLIIQRLQEQSVVMLAQVRVWLGERVIATRQRH